MLRVARAGKNEKQVNWKQTRRLPTANRSHHRNLAMAGSVRSSCEMLLSLSLITMQNVVAVSVCHVGACAWRCWNTSLPHTLPYRIWLVQVKRIGVGRGSRKIWGHCMGTRRSVGIGCAVTTLNHTLAHKGPTYVCHYSDLVILRETVWAYVAGPKI